MEQAQSQDFLALRQKVVELEKKIAEIDNKKEDKMILVEKLREPGLGFDRIHLYHGSTFLKNPTIVIVPTRGMIHNRIVNAWQSLITPMNQHRIFMFAVGHEVGKAYDLLIENILANPELSKWKYILTLEDDNIPPPDAHIRLIESIEQFKFDAVSGIYFTKGQINMPMAYGNAMEYSKNGVLDFRPVDIREALNNGNVMEVNGIAMGCALWRLDLFRELPKPWFVTVNDIIPDKGISCYTQDLYFCERAKRNGKRFGVDMRVKVGHLDVNDGVTY